jgi:hypothetical protein
MKRLLTLAAAALLSFPLLAAEKEQAKPAEPQAKPAADSPMVAAAKRTNRGAKKAIVITNDDVKVSKGRLTTTSVVRPVFVPEPQPTPEMLHAEKQAKERAVAAEQAAKAAKAEAARKAELEKAARAVGDEEYGEDAYVGGDPPAGSKP